MTHPVPPLLTRLRRHRGLWVIVLAALLIKLVSTTVCAADVATPAYAAASVVEAVAHDVAAPDQVQDTQDCLLGEAGGCHCACNHSLTVPVHATVAWGTAGLNGVPSTGSPGIRPAMTGSLLRPPIA